MDNNRKYYVGKTMYGAKVHLARSVYGYSAFALALCGAGRIWHDGAEAAGEPAVLNTVDCKSCQAQGDFALLRDRFRNQDDAATIKSLNSGPANREPKPETNGLRLISAIYELGITAECGDELYAGFDTDGDITIGTRDVWNENGWDRSVTLTRGNFNALLARLSDMINRQGGK